ncbi:MAG: hypothetical protein JXK93_10455 [Sphaerochaetaceae bacterium]|nr:hypothetical protein [Sphaerochaetaceae bacterium]
MAVPPQIRRFKPTGFGSCEIHAVKGGRYYYVYRTYSVYDPQRKGARKKTGRAIGKITAEQGFVPNAYGKSIMNTRQAPRLTEYGIYELFAQLDKGVVLSSLKQQFPDHHRTIYTLAMLRLAHHCRSGDAKRMFERSIFKQLYPSLTLGQRGFRSFMKTLGSQGNRIDAYMRSHCTSASTSEAYLFEGSSLFSSTSSAAGPRAKGQCNVQSTSIPTLYLFSPTGYTPLSYHILPDKVPDRDSWVQACKGSSVDHITILGNPGFYSIRNTHHLDANGISYILPLHHLTPLIEEKFAQLPGTEKFDGYFLHNERIIWYARRTDEAGHCIYIYQDEAKKSQKEKLYLQRLAHDYGGHSRKAFESRTRDGMFSLFSSIDTTAEKIYHSYRVKEKIEHAYSYLSNTVQLGVCYQQTNEEMAAWSFLNHISLLLFSSLIRALETRGLSDTFLPQDIISIVRNVSLVHWGHEQPAVSEIAPKEEEVLHQLGVDITSQSRLAFWNIRS